MENESRFERASTFFVRFFILSVIVVIPLDVLNHYALKIDWLSALLRGFATIMVTGALVMLILGALRNRRHGEN